MNLEKLTTMLVEHEGEKLFPYVCPAGKTTIGAGRNLSDKGISQEESRFLLNNDIKECFDDLQTIFIYQFEKFPEAIQHCLIDMRFNLGYSGFRKFKKMIKAVNDRNMEEMIIQMRDSAWYRQVTSRAEHLIKMMKEG